MNRNLLLIGGVVTTLGVASALAVAGHNARARAASDDSAVAASMSSCCEKGEATAASGTCTRNMTTTASLSGQCSRSAAHTADMTTAAGCDHAQATTAGASSCEKGAATTTAMGGEGCCKSGEAKSASAEACKETCEAAKTASAFNGAVDELPYAENKRVVLAGAYVCGHCNLHATEGCSPMFKTADGKVYPLIRNPEADKLRAANTGNGVEIASTVKKLDGIKYLEVKSYKSL